MNRLSTHQTDELVNSIVGLLASSRYDFTQLLDQINALQSVGVVGDASDDWIDVNDITAEKGLNKLIWILPTRCSLGCSSRWQNMG